MCNTFSNQIMIYRKKDTATRTATEEATSSQISRTMPPTHLHKNNASIPRSTLLITVAYEYNSSLCILKNPAKRARRSETTSIPVCICNLFSRRKKKTRKCMATTLPFKDISQNAALAHHIIVADNEDDGTKDSISFARSNS